MFNEGNQIHNFISSSGSGTVINFGSGSDFLTSYGSGSTRQKVTVPTVPVPQHCYHTGVHTEQNYIFLNQKKDLQVELLKPEPCYDLSYGHDVCILLPHTGEHHQGQLDVECAQALQELIPTLGSRFDFLTNNSFSTFLCEFCCEAII